MAVSPDDGHGGHVGPFSRADRRAKSARAADVRLEIFCKVRDDCVG